MLYTEIHIEMYMVVILNWGLDQLKIKGYISKKDTEEKDKGKVFPSSKFKYDEFNDIFICPNNKILRFTPIMKKIFTDRSQNGIINTRRESNGT